MKKINGLYMVTLPERTIRSFLSATTGVSSLLTGLLLPKAVKDSSTYRVTFGMLQQFLIEKVAEVEQENNEIELKDKYVIRKTAGSVIEGIGLLSIRFSPVWMLAILSDVAGGSKIYLQRLIKDLERNNLIDADGSYESVYDVLDGINTSSRLGVDAIDLPPISKEEFAEFKDALVSQFHKNNASSLKMYKDLEHVYRNMNKASKAERISLAKLNGTMTLDLMKNTSKKGFDITKVTAKTSLDMIHEVVITNYAQSLEQLNQIGKRKYLIDHMTPFMKQFKNHFSEDKITLTEKIMRKVKP